MQIQTKQNFINQFDKHNLIEKNNKKYSNKLKNEKINRISEQMKFFQKQSQKYKKQSIFYQSQKSYFKNRIQQLFLKNDILETYINGLQKKLNALNKLIKDKLPDFLRNIIMENDKSLSNTIIYNYGDNYPLKFVDRQLECLQFQLSQIFSQLVKIHLDQKEEKSNKETGLKYESEDHKTDVNSNYQEKIYLKKSCSEKFESESLKNQNETQLQSQYNKYSKVFSYNSRDQNKKENIKN